jgi:hypothetical protein
MNLFATCHLTPATCPCSRVEQSAPPIIDLDQNMLTSANSDHQPSLPSTATTLSVLVLLVPPG